MGKNIPRSACFVNNTATENPWQYCCSAPVFVDSDACVTPVLSMEEATNHPHHQKRRAFTQLENKMLVPSEFLKATLDDFIVDNVSFSSISKTFIISWCCRQESALIFTAIYS
jgi:hypothetical protein